MTNIAWRLLIIAVACLPSSLSAAPVKQADKKNTILFYGNSMVERLLEHGELEARFQIAKPKAGLKIRSLAWTGDEVGNRLRLEGYAKHMKNLIAEWPAGTLVLGYGFYESFAGSKGLSDFEEQYRTHLEQLAIIHPGAKIVMLSPIASEDAPPERNADLKLYTQSVKKIAAEVNATVIDLFSAVEKHYIPESDKILVHSKLLGPNSKQELVFTAPEKPGKSPYVCTFPGHWRIMQGVLTVATNKPKAQPPAKVKKGNKRKGK